MGLGPAWVRASSKESLSAQATNRSPGLGHAGCWVRDRSNPRPQRLSLKLTAALNCAQSSSYIKTQLEVLKSNAWTHRHQKKKTKRRYPFKTRAEHPPDAKKKSADGAIQRPPTLPLLLRIPRDPRTYTSPHIPGHTLVRWSTWCTVSLRLRRLRTLPGPSVTFSVCPC